MLFVLVVWLCSGSVGMWLCLLLCTWCVCYICSVALMCMVVLVERVACSRMHKVACVMCVFPAIVVQLQVHM